MNPRLLEEYRAFGKKGLPLEKAKVALSSAGWGVDEINQVVEQYAYRLTNPDENINDNSAGTDAQIMKIGELMLDEERNKRRDIAIVDGLAAEYAPDLQSKLYYQNKFYDDIGLSWWWIIGAGIAYLVLLFIGVPNSISYLISSVAIVIFIIVNFRRYLIKHK